MKRKKKRLIDDFKKIDLYVQTFQSQYSKEMYLLRTIKDYTTLSSVPILILEAYIRFLNEKIKDKID